MIIRPKNNKKRKKNKAHKIDEFERSYIKTINGVDIHSFPKVEASASERIIRDYLKRNDIEYIREASFGNGYRYDFLLPRWNIIIEYDGQDYHHTPKQKERDKRKEDFAVKKGFTVYRLNKQHWNKLQQSVEDIILSLILQRRYD